MKKRIFLSILLTLCMMFTVLPQVAFAEGEGTATSAKDITLGYSALHNGDTANGKWDSVYFGSYGGNPIKWRVLSTEGSSTTTGAGTIDDATYKTDGGKTYAGNALFMVSENTLTDAEFGSNNTYQGSNLQGVMKGILSSASKELKYVLKTTKTDTEETISDLVWDPSKGDYVSKAFAWSASELVDDTLFALSAREVEQYLGRKDNRKSGDKAYWWLRSFYSEDPGVISNEGNFGSFSVSSKGVRPALNLNLSSVLFTSAAVGGKASDASTGELSGNKDYASITVNDGYRLTLLDESRSAFSAELKSISGSVATISYSGATTGSNEKISAIVKNGDAVKYYGRVAAVTEASDANGEADITLPFDFSTANGDVLCVFNEQYNGDKNTDYASKLIDVTPFEYTVKFDANGGEGTMAAQTMTTGVAAELSANTFTRTGYTFTGWNTNADGTGKDYSDEQSVKNLISDASESPVTLYAQWSGNNYKVTFNTAGGTAVSEKTNVKWEDEVLDGVSDPTRDGYEFKGWKCENVTVESETTYAELAKKDTVKSVELTAQWADVTAPTGEIKTGTNSWKTFLNNITFGLFFKDTQKVEITATDNSGEDITIEYLLSNKELTEAELPATAFTSYNGEFNIEPDNEYVIYAKLTDKSGNTAYINSDGIVLDSIKPVISGVENGKTYCEAQTVTVTEKYVDTVTVNGKTVKLDANGRFTLSSAEGAQAVVATDKAGNVSAELTVTVNDGHTGGTADCTHKAKCGICGEEYGEIDAANHTALKHTKAEAATCTEAGNNEYWYCDDCKKYFADEEGTVETTLEKQTIPATGHDMTHVDAVAATDKSEGNIEYWHCDTCGKYFLDEDGTTEITLADTVIAKLPKTDSDNNSAQTGDNSHMALWLALLFVSGGALAGTAIYSRKRKYSAK